MKKLNEKAMLVKLTMRRANLTRRDQTAEQIIQQTMDDTSLVVNSKLFRDKLNPINKIMSDVSTIYTYHKDNTLPYMDKGPRILPITMYEEYTASMRDRINKVDNMVGRAMPHYNDYVLMDIAYRSQDRTKPQRAKIEDYPTAEEFEHKLGYDLRFLPLPDTSHFLFDIDEADLKAFQESTVMAERIARDDAVKRMLTPLVKLVDKLNKPIDSDGSIFRDSAIENVIEGIELAKKLCMDESPEVVQLINSLNAEVSKYANDVNWLRASPPIRDQAAKKLADIASQMGAFMGVA
jgi:hypothetical protein